MNSTAPSTTDLSVANNNSATLVRASPAMVMRCLLVSVDQSHSDIIESTAANEGWMIDSCAAVDQALRLAFRNKFHLAFVDIQSTEGSPLKVDFEELASDLAKNHVPLLIVSGDANDPLAEIRARQLGVWLYLPGFDGKTELDVVFRDARAVHEKLARDAPAEIRHLKGSTAPPGG